MCVLLADNNKVEERTQAQVVEYCTALGARPYYFQSNQVRIRGFDLKFEQLWFVNHLRTYLFAVLISRSFSMGFAKYVVYISTHYYHEELNLGFCFNCASCWCSYIQRAHRNESLYEGARTLTSALFLMLR